MKAPDFWLHRTGRAAAPTLRTLLTPLGWLYGAVVQHKLKRSGLKAPVPVICVGNLTLGGTGKTPVVRHIGEQLTANGHSPVVLSRGYGGELPGPVMVDPATHTAADVGDEPLMLARTLPVMIARDRAAGVRALGTLYSHIILDDGMQNPSVHKDTIIVVVDAATGFGNHHLFPAGPLREPIRTGLNRADLLIVMGEGDADGDIIAQSSKPIIRATLTPTAAPPAGSLVAFAGIGRPEKFFDGLRAAGGMLVETIPFDDHHPYTPADLGRLTALAAHHNATLVTTEKDWVRLPVAAQATVAAFPVRLQPESDLMAAMGL